MKATILDTQTGTTHTEEGINSLAWFEGNYSCDCNRAQIAGEHTGVCEGCYRYLVVKAEFEPGETEYTLLELNEDYPEELVNRHCVTPPDLHLSYGQMMHQSYTPGDSTPKWLAGSRYAWVRGRDDTGNPVDVGPLWLDVAENVETLNAVLPEAHHIALCAQAGVAPFYSSRSIEPDGDGYKLTERVNGRESVQRLSASLNNSDSGTMSCDP